MMLNKSENAKKRMDGLHRKPFILFFAMFIKKLLSEVEFSFANDKQKINYVKMLDNIYIYNSDCFFAK